jgi:hypothetical protein
MEQQEFLSGVPPILDGTQTPGRLSAAPVTDMTISAMSRWPRRARKRYVFMIFMTGLPMISAGHKVWCSPG